MTWSLKAHLEASQEAFGILILPSLIVRVVLLCSELWRKKVSSILTVYQTNK